jgi:TolA-binding protein
MSDETKTTRRKRPLSLAQQIKREQTKLARLQSKQDVLERQAASRKQFEELVTALVDQFNGDIDKARGAVDRAMEYEAALDRDAVTTPIAAAQRVEDPSIRYDL